jgi:gliding motility-associated-like protein
LVQLPKGLYTFTITDQRGCTKTDSIELIEPDPVSISAEVLKKLVCESDTDGVVLLTPYGGRAPYQFTWNGKTTKDSLMRSLQAGNFKAVVTDSMGCKDSLEISLDGTPTYKCGLFFPEGFSPNGDGKNDFFTIKGILDFPENELTIYNRWGELVFQTFNYNNDWDGKASVRSLMSGNNGYLPNDTYYYVFTSKSNNKSYSGYIYLIR